MSTNYADAFARFEAASPIANPGDYDTSEMPLTKAARVERAAAEKQRELANQNGYVLSTMSTTGAGQKSASQVDRDYLSLSPYQFRLKYGEQLGSQYDEAYSRGDTARRMDLQRERSGAQIFGDTANTLMRAPVSLLGAIAALGTGGLEAGGIAPTGSGVKVSQALSAFENWARSGQSEGLQGQQRVAETETALRVADNKQQQVIDEKAYGSTTAGAIRIANDLTDGLAANLSNPTIASDLIANAAGSLLGGGVVSKALTKIGSLTLKGATATGAVTEGGAVAAQLSKYGSRATMPTSIVGMESGAAYQQTTDAAYNELIAQGVSPEEAAQRANKAGLEASAIQGAITAGIMPVTGGAAFERAPFRAPNIGSAIKTVLGETVEEGIQEGSAQYSQNQAIQDQINPNQSLVEGVGQQAAAGMVGGLGSSAIGQAPGLALRGAVEAAKLPFRAVGAAITYQGDRVAARNQKVQDDLLAGLYEQADQAMPEAVSEAETIAQDPSIPQDGAAKMRAWIASMDKKYGLGKKAQGAAEIVNSGVGSAKTKLDAALELIDGVRASESAQVDETPEPLVNSTLQNIKDVIANTSQSEAVQKAVESSKALFAKAAPVIQSGVRAAIAKLDTKNPSTVVDAQAAADRLVGLAETNPDKLDVNTVNNVLYSAGQGGITLTPIQSNALRMGIVQARTAQAQSELASRYGLADAQAVANQVLTDARVKGQKLSLQEHLKAIRASLDTGDREVTTRALRELRSFAQHLSNQVFAINEALLGGNTNEKRPVVFDAHVGNGVFKPIGSRYIQPTSQKSVKIAQEMAAQAVAVGTAINNLSDAFPDFGIKHVEIPSLDASLNGDAATVAQEYATGTRKVPVNETGSADLGTETQGSTEAGKVEQDQASSDVKISEENNADQPLSEQPVETPAEKPAEPKADTALTQAENAPVVEEKTPTNTIEQVAEPAAEPVKDTVTPAQEEEKTVTNERVGGDTNRITRAFSEPEKAKTRTAEAVSPLQDVKDALSSEDALREKLGETELNRRFTKEIADQYRDLLAAGDRIIQVMTARMQKAVKSKLGRLSFEELLPKLEAGALNAVIQDANGNYIYDPKIVESAVLAGLQWVLKMNSHGVTMTDEAVREAFGLANDAYIPDGLADRLSSGLSTAEVSRSLAQAIGQFLGLKERTDIPVNEAQAVKEGLAKEVLTALIDQGLVDEFKVDISEISTRDNVSDVVRFRPGVLREADVIDENGNTQKGNVVRDEQGNWIRAIAPDAIIRGFPNAIEKAVLTDTQPESFVGEVPTEVAKTQLRSDTPVTKEQQEVIKAEQAIEHNVNLPFIDLLTSAGQKSEELVLRLFAGQIDDTMNENHKRSVEGRRLTFQSAFRSIQNLMAEVTNVASKSGRDLDTVPVHYRYAYTVVNRLQMLGKDNPQSSKLMREAILPTWDVLDLTDSENRLKFSLGLAQALGVKVHKVQPNVMLVELKDALAKFPKTLEMLGNSNFKLTEEAVDAMREEGVESPVMLHALMEYARLQKPETDKSKFKTALYFEADGVTNGVVNAMSLFSSGSFTPNWVSDIQRGGLWIGEQALSLAGIRQTGSDALDDLYGKAAENTTFNVRKLIEKHQGQDTGEVILSVLHVLTTLLPKGIQYDEKSNTLRLDRAATKNPLTIMLYGSGAMGIAGNILDEALNSMYERFSQAAARKKADPSISDGQAFFGGDKATADEKWDRFIKAMRVLGANKLAKEENNLYVVETGVDRVLSGSNFTDYTVDKAAKRALQESFLHAFVTPMVNGITRTVGNDLISTMDLIKKQTQTWSLVGQFMYQNAYEKALKAKREANPDMGTYDLLSKDEEDFIRKQIDQNLPQFSTGTQNFTFGQQQRLNFPFMTSKNGKPLGLEFSRALDDRFETPAYGYMPGDAGVSGQPNMTIGNGDGQAVQNIIMNPETPKKRLQIFDGIHSTIAELDKMGLAANKGVFDSWQRNPMADLAKAFRSFADQVDLSSLSEEQLKTLAKSIFGKWTEIPDPKDLETAIKSMAVYGERTANDIAARQRVLASVQHSVDQMAGAATPYSNSGLILSGSAAAKAAQLNRLLAAEKAKNEPVRAFEAPKGTVTPETAETSVKASKAKFEPKAQKPVSTQMNMFSALGAPVSLFGRALEKAIAKISDNLLTRALLRDVVRSDKLKDYTVYTGSREALINRAADMGIVIPADRQATFNGMIHPESRQMFVLDGDAETMLHESIHAVTYETVAAHYRGEDVGPEAKAAITRLEGLMVEFRDANLEGQAYANALAEMNRQFMADNKAGELNEFMAWSLSNEDIRDQLQNTKVIDKALRIGRQVVQAIKALLWGGKRSAAVKDDLFTNIRFNTAIIMRSNPTPSEMTSSATLYHDPSFGNDQRLIKLLESVKSKIADYITEDVISRVNLARRAGLEPAKETDAAKGFEKDTRGKVNRGRIQGASAAIAFDRVGFDFTMQQRMAFVMMVSVMATAAELDANATSRMQEMYTHVVSNLSVDDFLRDPTSNNPDDNEQANKKFNLLTGGFANRTDNLDRSLILPAFVALAATNPQFRGIIGKMPMPKGNYVGWNSVDNILDNIGDMGMDAVSRVVSGEGALTKNVQDSIDNLVSQMLETNAEVELYIEKYTKPVGSAIDRVNEGMVSLFNWLGEKAEANLEKAKTDPDAKIKLALASSLKTLTGILHEPTGQETAMKVMSTANQSEGLWKPFYDLLKDLVGRTVENAQVYDLIKLARYHVSSLRQQFVEELPKIINNKFTRDLTEVEQTAMFKGLAQTDLASLLGDNTIQEILKWVSNPAARDIKIKELSDTITDLSPDHASLIIDKAEQLAEYMINKKTGSNLLRNADAIAHLLDEGKVAPVTSKEMVKAIDHLVSLKALSKISSRDSIALSSLVLSEKEGLNFVLNSMRGQRETELAKADGNARFNHYKGHMTSTPGDSVSLIVAHDNETAKLLEKSYIRLGPLVGSPRDPSAKNRSYFYAPVSGRAAYSQGIAQNVQQTVFGVDHASGFTLGTTGGAITDPKFIAKIRQNKAAEKLGSALLPVFDAKGNLYAFERQVDPAMLDRLQGDTNLAKMMGARGGRQAEEAAAMTINRLLIDNLRDMWDRDRRAGRQNEYQDLFKSTDPVVQDSVSILSNEMKMYITARFPEGFMVRSDMVDDAIGYRAASIGDVWTGTSRWSEQTQEMVKKALMGMFGNRAYAYAVRAEKFWQNAIIQDIRTMIIIRSVIVPMANAASNVYQLIGRGVPMTSIFRSIPKKTAEIESWHKTRIRQMEAEAELLATTDLVQRRKLEAEIKAISDSHKRLSIWPLLERGEFSSISDAGSREDVLLTQGKLSDFIEAQIDKLPTAVRTAGKYAIISKDTALFRALQKTVDYGDFVAKAILYDDLTKRQRKTKEEALAHITEEFVNYDRLPGRDRQYLESVGFLWFWNFKVRSSKVALSMLRNNPVHAIIAANMPLPINGIGLPLEDNLWSSLFDGRLFNSFGLHMGFRAPGLLPLGGLLG